jgi:hypothetical protein
LASAQADKTPIAGSDINNHAPAIRRDQIFKGGSIELVKAFTADDFQHKMIQILPDVIQSYGIHKSSLKMASSIKGLLQRTALNIKKIFDLVNPNFTKIVVPQLSVDH